VTKLASFCERDWKITGLTLNGHYEEALLLQSRNDQRLRRD
jgi:hypothetical protein